MVPVFLAAIQQVHATSDSWNVDAAGNWTTLGSWLSGTQVPGSTTIDNTDIATFGFTLTADRIVTVDTTRYIGGISFGNTSAFKYTLSGGALNLNNGGVIQTLAANGAHTDTISSTIKISGTGAATASFTANATLATSLLSIGAVTGSATIGNTATLTLNGTNTGANAITGVIGDGAGGGKLAITKSGTGLWVLSGANTYTGGTKVSQGSLTVSGDQSAANGGWNIGNSDNVSTQAVTFSSGSTIAVASGKTFQLGNTAASGAAATLGVSGTVNNSGALNVQRAATLTINSGGVWTQSGSMQINPSAGSGASAAMTIASGGSFTYNNSATSLIQINPASGGAGSAGLTISGTLTTNQGFTNTTASTTGGTGATITLAGGTLKLSADISVLTATAGSAFNFTLGTGGGTIDTQTFSVTMNRAIGGTTGLTKAGAGTLTLSAINTYAGATTISAGTLLLSGVGTLGNGGALTLSGGTLDLGALSQTVGAVSITAAAASGNTIQNGSLTGTSYAASLASGNAVVTANLLVNGTAGLAMSGSGGTLTLAGANTYTGNTSVTAGTLNLSNSLALQSSTLTTGGTGIIFDSSVASHSFTFGGISGSTALSLLDNATTPNAVALTVGGSNASTTYSGILSGTGGSLTKTGTGTLTLSGANTYTGGTTVSGGVLSTSTSSGNTTNNFGAGPINVQSGGTLSISSTRNVTWGTLTLNGAGASGQAGALVAGAASSFSNLGSTSVVLGSDSTIGTNSGGNGFTIAGTISLGAFNLTLNPNITNGAITASGVISGSGSVTQNSSTSGTTTLSGANTYTGATTISAGTLIANNAGVTGTSSALGKDSAVTLANSASTNLQLNTSVRIGSLSGGGTTGGNVQLAANTLTTGVDNSTTSYAGVISGTGGSLTKIGTGTMALTGANTYTGATTVNAGALQVGSSGSGQTGTGAVSLASGGMILGTGIVQGSSFTAASGSTVQAGDSTAQNSYGTLTFTPVSGSGAFNFQSGSSVILGLNPGGVSDVLVFNGTGANTLTFNSNLKIGPDSFTPVATAVFALLDWSGLASSPTFGSQFSTNLLRDGSADNGSAWDLPDISGSGYVWDLSQFTTNGSIAIVAVPEPVRVFFLGLGVSSLLLRRRRTPGFSRV